MAVRARNRTMYAQKERDRTAQRQSIDLQSLRMIDFFKLFPNVGALVVWGNPTMPASRKGCSRAAPGHSIDERVLLTAGHCIAWAAGGLAPFIKFSVTFSPNALDRSTSLILHCRRVLRRTCANFEASIREPDTRKRGRTRTAPGTFGGGTMAVASARTRTTSAPSNAVRLATNEVCR